ncbi:LLM class flavin-dependent oxidoreductase [Streptomyces litmocidini]|uniref:LLM class flavin-dependent oxidoreductase n=1 Tax=Streptomyces litmocidini TaxID=67318 RepID=UPI0037012675
MPPYDSVRFGDAGSVFETFTHLGHLAAVTENAALGTGAVVLPLRGPPLVAKAAATVDVLPGGRMLLGLASGDRPVEYPLFGRDCETRGTAFREDVLPHFPTPADRPSPAATPGAGGGFLDVTDAHSGRRSWTWTSWPPSASPAPPC